MRRLSLLFLVFAVIMCTVHFSADLTVGIYAADTVAVYGDVNADGYVDGTDAMLLNRYTSGWSRDDYAAAANLELCGDVNADGYIDGTDAMLLNRYTSGWSRDDYAAAVNLGKEVPSVQESFTVTFVDWDGTVLDTQSVAKGESAVAPESPERSGYTFSGWDLDYSSVTSDLTVTAQYVAVVNPTFVVDEVEAEAGDDSVEVKIAVANNPGISSIGMYVTYAEGLTLNSVTYNSAIGGQAVPPAKLTSPVKLTWVNAFADVEDDWTFVTLNFSVASGASGELPVSITYNADDVYDLSEENVTFDIVNGSVTVAAGDSTTYTVKFVDYDGTVLDTQTVAEGDAAIAPTDPVRDGYVFSGWDSSFDNITGDLTVTAQYTALTGPTFVVSSVEAQAGQENVQVTVSMQNNPGISSIGMYVTYAEGLTLNSVTYNTAMGGQAVPPADTASPVKLTWVNAFGEVSEDCTFVTLDFTVSSDAAGTLPITLKYNADDVYDLEEVNINFSIVNGSIIVK